MSDSEKTENESTENVENIVDNTTEDTNNLLNTAMGLKDSNPKVFFGAIAAIVVVVLIVIMSSGSSNKLPQTASKNLSIGQQYSLQGANSNNNVKSSISMVAAPGISAFDDSEEEGSDRSCKQQPAGTSIKILDFQNFAGKKDAFAQVEVLSDGNCLGRKGWVLAIDIQ